MCTRLFITTILAAANKRPPTDAELTLALKAAIDYAAGEYVYIESGERRVTDHVRALIINARIAGKTYREICDELEVSSRTVADVLSNSP